MFISPPVDDSVVVHPVIVTMVTKSLPMLDVVVVVVVVVDTHAFIGSSSIFAKFDSALVVSSISAVLAFGSFAIVAWLSLMLWLWLLFVMLLLLAFKNIESISWIWVLDFECLPSMIEFVVLLLTLVLLLSVLPPPVPLLLLLLLPPPPPPIIAGIRKRLFRVRL